MNIVSIGLVFENCESCIIPIECVSSFYLGNISDTISYYSLNSYINRSKSVGELLISFSERFYIYDNKTTCDEPVLDRIKKYNDICNITVYFEDGFQESYNIIWREGSTDYENLGQSFDEEGGVLFLGIK